MSISVMDRVWRHSKAARGDLLIMLAIADFANDQGEAWPSVGTLAEKSRLCERETRYALRRLEGSGELKTRRNKGPRGCHLYQITIAENTGAELAGGQNLPGGRTCRGQFATQGGQFTTL
jgi:Helix-turn-helix domain